MALSSKQTACSISSVQAVVVYGYAWDVQCALSAREGGEEEKGGISDGDGGRGGGF